MVSFKRGLTAGAATAVLLLAVGTAQAQDRSFNIPAQPIAQALPELARQAGVQISAPTGHLGRVQAPAVTGTMDVEDAIARMIASTDLEIASREGSIITLRQRQAITGEAARVSDIVVVGSRIGGRLNEALPVTVVDSDELDAIGATDGDDLFRAIAQTGDVNFNDADTDNGGINNARGDVASIDLRAIGTGNTLKLLNGRRLVAHPGTQVESFVPVTTVNTNAIPTMGIRRVEVMADGAAALYGTDAVAGVVNSVLKSNFEGFTVEAGMGRDEGGMEEYSLNFQAGKDFNKGKTNVSIMGDYLTRDPLYIWEREYATVAGRVARFAGRATGLDYGTYSTLTAWAEGIRLNPTTYKAAGATTKVNGQTLTSSAGTFHIQPSTNPGCLADGFLAGTCFDNSTLATSATGDDANLRYDLDTMRTISSAVDRANLFTFINHEFDNGIEAFGEIGYYWANTWSQRQQDTPLDSQRVLMSSTAYWNPLGATGVTARLPGLTTGTGTAAFPAGGAAVEIQDFRFSDLGYRSVDVENETTRLVGGLRGVHGNWDWETGMVYSKASVADVMDAISMTELQKAINLTTTKAYNPFGGGNLLSTKDGRFDVNDADTLAQLAVRVKRVSETELMMWDFKVANPEIYQLPGGPVGFAAGVEARRETFAEDRDDRLDGTITFTDLAGGKSMSDVMGVSYTPDSEGARNVYSIFGELAFPVISPEMNIPFVQSVDMQLAARVENYSLFGTVGAPKVAMSYRPNDWLMFRSAWSKGFRAPNLMQLHQPDFERSNSRRDYAACKVQLEIGAIETLTTSNDYCTSEDRIEQRSGNKNLKAENSENFSIGMVLEPKLWPSKYGKLTLTVDYWQIEQTDLVGIFGGTNQLIMDYYLREIGQVNENLVRADPTEQQIADGAAAGRAPVGTLLSIKDEYWNLLPRSSSGIDYRMLYNLRKTPIGRFTWSLNVSQRTEMFQSASASHRILLDALADGVISNVTVGGVENLLGRNGRPEWKVASTLTWSDGPWQAGLFSSYVSDFYDTSANMADGSGYWVVDDWLTHNLYVQYTFDKKSWASGARVRIGARNIEDKEPPLADDRFGYNGSVHSNRGRWWYATVRKSF